MTDQKQSPKPPVPLKPKKQGFWSRALQSIGEAIGEAKFGGK